MINGIRNASRMVDQAWMPFRHTARRSWRRSRNGNDSPRGAHCRTAARRFTSPTRPRVGSQNLRSAWPQMVRSPQTEKPLIIKLYHYQGLPGREMPEQLCYLRWVRLFGCLQRPEHRSGNAGVRVDPHLRPRPNGGLGGDGAGRFQENSARFGGLNRAGEEPWPMMTSRFAKHHIIFVQPPGRKMIGRNKKHVE